MSFASIWSENFFHLRDSFGGNCSFKLLRFQSGLTPGKVVGSNKSNLRLLATNAEEKNQRSQSKKPCSINLSLHDGSIRSCSSGSINNSKLRELKVVQCYNLPHISARKVSDSPAVIIVFDIETTGLSRQNERIIEIAFRVLYGGKNSTFQTLVNPGMKVTNADIHGIRSDMVNGPDVPRFEELLPILLQFIKSCQRDGKKIAFVAHNARRFDVPFLIKEFQRCKVEVPEDWLFVDTLPLAKKLRKLDVV